MNSKYAKGICHLPWGACSRTPNMQKASATCGGVRVQELQVCQMHLPPVVRCKFFLLPMPKGICHLPWSASSRTPSMPKASATCGNAKRHLPPAVGCVSTNSKYAKGICHLRWGAYPRTPIMPKASATCGGVRVHKLQVCPNQLPPAVACVSLNSKYVKCICHLR